MFLIKLKETSLIKISKVYYNTIESFIILKYDLSGINKNTFWNCVFKK